MMGGQQPAFPESLDEILNVVKETPRGRWFLDAYTSRVQSSSTSTILDAITKLESNLKSMSSVYGSSADAAVLQKARQHIAKARADIAETESAKQNLSAEGQLFAKLADLSRKAFTEPTADQTGIASNVERALRLVAELDEELGTSLVPMPVAAPKPAPQYFKQDEDIFQPAPAAKIATPAPVKVAPPVEVTTRGAKLVIHHVDAEKPAIPEVALVSEAPKQYEVPKEEAPMFATTPEASKSEAPEPSRIVIIRRNVDEAMDVPLMEEEAPALAAVSESVTAA